MTDAAVSQLIRTFGNFDREVLEAVLAVNDGDVKLATEFLQAEQGGYALDLNQPQDGVPQDYPSQIIPAGVVPQPNNSATGKMKALFLAEASLEDHFNAQKEDYDIYASVLLLLLNQGVEISKASRTRILACCWARNDHELADHLIYSHEDLFSLPQILPALNLLDAPRKIREIEKKIARLENSKIKTKPKKIGALKSLINDLNRETHIGSVSGALSKRIRTWARSIPEEKLSFFALSLPKEPWRQLADLIHLNPKKDFKIDWFLNAIFDEKLGADNILTACENITQENCLEIAKKYKVPYSFLRVNIKPLPENVKPIIANYETLDTLIWYFEELVHPEVYKIVDARLTSGEVPKFGYGKLMERMLYFKSINAPFYEKLIPVAEKRMQSIDLELESPVTVIGDASYSMDVAIRCSTIIGSILSVLANAQLIFFNTEAFSPKIIPKTIPEVLEVATTTKADGLTAAASSLLDYYNNKKICKIFIVVTDEVDNVKSGEYYFPTLFQKYYNEVYQAKIVFVSFLENPAEKGRMVKALEAMGIQPLQFRLDGGRPDLTKLDTILGILSSESSYFEIQTDILATTLKNEGIKAVFEKLSSKKLTEQVSQKIKKLQIDEEIEEELEDLPKSLK